MKRAMHLFFATVCVLVLGAFAVPTIAVAETETDEHCVYDVVGYEDDGVTMILEKTPDCYKTYEDLLTDRGAKSVSSVSGVSASQMSAASIIATHHDYDTNSTISISGSVCNGGGLNFSSSWINRIDATTSVCWAAHWDGYNYAYGTFLLCTQPPSEQLLPTYAQNRTNSARYYSYNCN